MKTVRRMLSIWLAVVMVLSLIPAAGFAQETISQAVSPVQIQLEQQVEADLADDETVTIMVELAEPAMGDIQLMSSAEQLSEHDRVQAAQAGFVQTMQAHRIKAEEIYRYQLLLNGISYRTTWQKAKQIAGLPGVKTVEVLTEYLPPEIEPQMGSSNDMIGAPAVWDIPFKGERQVVAVLDSGADPDHRDFVVSNPELAKYPDADSIAPLIRDNSLSGRWYNPKVPYGWNYSDRNDQIKEVAKLSGMHGMHVSGTVAANGRIQGVAPEAQLLIMRVFGEAGGGTNASVYVKAIEDAVVLGAGSVNMSLGSPAGVVSGIERTTINAIKRAADMGTVVNIAGGNEGQFAYTWDQPKADAPDYGVVGTPAIAPLSLAVASMENDAVMLRAIELADGTTIPYQMSDNSIRPTYDEPFEIVDGGLGRPEDLADVELNGKVAVIERGEITFVEKINNAHAKGAVAVMIYNHVAGGDAFISMNLDGALAPGLSIRRSDALRLIEEPQTITIHEQMSPVVSPTKGYMSDFSNWGMSTEFDIKPEISAPGGNIYSTFNDDEYGNMSGTSMATPHVAGGVALIQQRLDRDYPEITSQERYQLIKNLLMSYAVPQLDPESRVPVSPRKQGAGLMNLPGAALGNLVLIASDGQSKLNLGDVTDQFNLNFSVKNLGSSDVTLNVSGSLISDAVEGTHFQLRPRHLSDITADPVVVPAEQTVQLSIPVDAASFADELSRQMPNGYFLEGFVELSGDNETISLPFIGFRGNWEQVPVVEDFVYHYPDLSQDAPQYYTETGTDFTHLSTRIGSTSHIIGQIDEGDARRFDPAIVGISPNGDRNFDSFQFRGTFLRNYQDFQLRIYEAEGDQPIYETYIGAFGYGRKNHFSGRASWAKSVSYTTWSWDGRVNYSAVKDGDYILEVAAKLNRPDASEWTRRLPFKVDNQPPRFDNVTYDDQTGWLSFDISDGPGVGVAEVKVLGADAQAIAPEADGRYQIGTAVDLTKVRLQAGDHVMNRLDVDLASQLTPVADRASLIISAETDDGSPVPDYTLTVVNQAGEVQTNLSDLDFDTYTATVSDVAGGYEIVNPSQTITLTPDNPQGRLTFRFNKIVVHTERITFSLRTLPYGENYPDPVILAVYDQAGNRYQAIQSTVISSFYDVDLPWGEYTLRFENVAEGWLPNPASLDFSVTGPQDLIFIELIKGSGGTIRPQAHDETGQMIPQVSFRAINQNGQPVDLSTTLPYGTYEVAPTQDTLPEGLYPDPAYHIVRLSQSEADQAPIFRFRSLGDATGELTVITEKADSAEPDFDVAYVVEDYYGNQFHDVSDLPLGHYFVRPIAYPRHLKVTPQVAEASFGADKLSDSVTFSFASYRGTGTGSLTAYIKKPISFRGNGVLELTGSDGSVTELPFSQFDFSVRKNMPYDYYTVRAKTLPEGYYLKDPNLSILVQNSFASLDVEIEEGEAPAITGGLNLYSLDQASRVSLAGAIYEVRDSQDQIVTDTSGMPLGTYTVRLLHAPEGFRAVTERQTIELSADRPEVDVFFYFERGQAQPAIVALAQPEELTVEYATPFDQLALPETLSARLSNDETIAIAVNWSDEGYDAFTAGSYELTGQLDLTGLEVVNPDQLSGLQIVTVLEEVIPPREIVSLENLPTLYIPYGTTFADLPLADTVRVTLDDDSQLELAVRWLAGDYQADRPGSYDFIGELEIGSELDIINPKNLTAHQTIILLDRVIESRPIVSLVEPEAIETAFGTEFSHLALPKTVTARLADGTEVDLRVAWQAGDYDANQSGQYRLAGELDIPEIIRVTNPDNLQAYQTVIVLPPEPGPAKIIRLTPPADMTVAYGTPYRDLALPAEVTAELDNGETAQIPVIWQAGAYDPATPGSYRLIGRLVLPADIINPEDLTAEQVVIVGARPVRDIIAVASFSPIRLEVGQEESDAVLPERVMVLLDDDSTAELNLIWTLQDQTASSRERISLYRGEIVLPDDASITNSAGLTAHQIVIVALPEPVESYTERIAGGNRYETVARLALAQTDQSTTVILASGEDFPDALSAIPLAYQMDAALLLTAQAELPDATRQALLALAPERVILLGGQKAISQSIADALWAMDIKVERIRGLDRYQTAARIAGRLRKSSDTVYLVSGENFPDAISIGVEASLSDRPILLSARDELPAATRQALSDLAVKRVILIGGSQAIGQNVVDQLSALNLQVERIAAADRYQTNARIVTDRFDQSEQVVMASGEAFADALCGSLYAARTNQPLIISPADELRDDTKQLLEQLSVHQVRLLGGYKALSENLRLEIERYLTRP